MIRQPEMATVEIFTINQADCRQPIARIEASLEALKRWELPFDGGSINMTKPGKAALVTERWGEQSIDVGKRLAGMRTLKRGFRLGVEVVTLKS